MNRARETSHMSYSKSFSFVELLEKSKGVQESASLEMKDMISAVREVQSSTSTGNSTSSVNEDSKANSIFSCSLRVEKEETAAAGVDEIRAWTVIRIPDGEQP